MCRLIEEMLEETKREAERARSVEIALQMLEIGKLTIEEISRFCKLTIEEVTALSASMSSKVNCN